MTEFVFYVCAYTAFGILGYSGVGHALALDELTFALRTQRTLRRGFLRPVAVCIVICELAVFGFGLSSLVGWSANPHASLPLLAAGLLFAVFAMYSLFLVKFRPDSPCGCSGNDLLPVNVLVPLRATTLATLSLLAVLLSHTEDTLDLEGPKLAIGILAAIVFGTLIWELPIALSSQSRAVSRS